MTKRVLLLALCLLVVVLVLVPQVSCITSFTSASTAEVEDEIYALVNQARQQRGLNVLVRDPNLDGLARQASASKFADSVEESTELHYLMHNSWWVTYNGGSPRLDKGTAQKQVDYCLETPGLQDLMFRSEARATGVGVAIVDDAVYFTQVFDVLSAASGNGQPIKLSENAQSTDPSWAQLKAFLLQDNTDQQPYILGSFVCADFAAMLHNNAETAGIKSAYVSVDFTQGPSHALNAFHTTDRGLVYIDFTGQGFQSATPGGSLDSQNSSVSYKKVAYIEVGQNYGLISLDKANSFDYGFYQQWEQQWADYEAKVDLYNHGSLSWKEQQALRSQIDALRLVLGDYRWEPLGIVKDVYIHW
jgi:hypothetical protein